MNTLVSQFRNAILVVVIFIGMSLTAHAQISSTAEPVNIHDVLEERSEAMDRHAEECAKEREAEAANNSDGFQIIEVDLFTGQEKGRYGSFDEMNRAKAVGKLEVTFQLVPAATPNDAPQFRMWSDGATRATLQTYSGLGQYDQDSRWVPVEGGLIFQAQDSDGGFSYTLQNSSTGEEISRWVYGNIPIVVFEVPEGKVHRLELWVYNGVYESGVGQTVPTSIWYSTGYMPEVVLKAKEENETAGN